MEDEVDRHVAVPHCPPGSAAPPLIVNSRFPGALKFCLDFPSRSLSINEINFFGFVLIGQFFSFSFFFFLTFLLFKLEIIF